MINRLRARDEQGFTLLELVVAMSVVSVLFGLAAVVVGRGSIVVRKVQSHVDVVTDVQYALDTMSKDVRVADPIFAAAPSSMTTTVRRAGTCTLVTYAVEAAPQLAGSGYRNTGFALTQRKRPCGSSTQGAPRTLIRAVPAAAQPFAYYTKDSATPIAGALSTAALATVARVVVTASGVPGDTTAIPTISTDINVRNAAT